MSTENKLSVELYAKVIDSMVCGFIVANNKGEFIIWNEAAYKMFKKELITSVQDNWVEDWGIFHMDKTTKFLTEEIPMSRALKGETVKGVKMYISVEGREGMFLKVSAYPVYTSESEIEAAIVMLEDITEEEKFWD
ncbi:MAG: PAS domain-containing protein, partial [Bacteroidia bacterium]|nr:PAS domain-containing protein [Bacteroidia bacterium]